MTQQDLRKAAVLIASLDTRSADRLLDQMSEREAQAIRNAIMELDSVSADESDAVIAEFMREDQLPENRVPSSAVGSSGVELDPSLANAIQGQASRPTHSSVPVSPKRTSTPFRFLHETAGEMLSDYLQHEHPQTVALVLAHLPPVRAAEVVVQLPPTMQAGVLRRIADLGETDASVVAEVERILEAHVSRHLQVVERRTAGLATVQAILNAAETQERRQVIHNLSDHETGLANSLKESQPTDYRQYVYEPPAPPEQKDQSGRDNGPPQPPTPRQKPPMSENPKPTAEVQPAKKPDPLEQVEPIPFEFDQLAELHISSLARVMQHLDQNVILIGLVGAPTKLVNKIMRQLPTAEAKALRRRIDQQGPMRLRDIELAQQQIASMAGKLIAAGQIVAPKLRRFAITA